MKTALAGLSVIVTVAICGSSLSAVRGDGANTPPDIPGMVWIAPGAFTMGSPSTEPDRLAREGPQTAVVITTGYYIGQHEVTQGEYEAVIGANPSEFKGDTNRPVETVTWFDATNYCGKLTAQEREAGRIQANWAYRLPTEAEWEHACRAGTTTRFSFGDDLGYEKLGNHGWYNGNSVNGSHAVALKLPNAWGLFDMHGNVWEYCSDWFADALPGGTVSDPVGPASGFYCVVRGGSWFLGPSYCRSAYRGEYYVNGRSSSVGFRVVLASQSVQLAITVQPRSQKVGEGSSVSFTVEAIGEPPLAYQWRKDGVDLADGERISGAATASLTIRLVQASDAGSYDVVVRDARGSAVSRAAALTLVDPNAPPDVPGMIWTPSGAFTMGSPSTEPDRLPREGPQTTVVISRGYYVGRHEVTQGEYEAVMGRNPSEFKGDTNRPVEMVTWSDATNYCGKLTVQEREAGRIQAGWAYRLPTEAEWEYACRAGTTTRFSFGDDVAYENVGGYAWHGGNSGSTAHTVELKLPNPWGLFDVHGNVWEYCWDWFADALPGGTVADPAGPSSGTYCVVRGGSWYLAPSCSRSAYRGDYYVDGRSSSVGFRVVLAPLVSPTITAQPQNLTVAEGASATFTVGIGGSPPFSYQWTFNGNDIAGATGSKLSLTAVTAAQAGAYAVKVSNEVGSVTSDAATLTVNPKPTAPKITKQSGSLTVFVGGTATFTVEATGTAPLSYQWRRNGVSLSGATSPTLTIQNVQASHAGTYTVRVSNPYGSATSQGAVLSVDATPVPPAIAAAPEDRVVNAGTDVTLSVTATGTAPLAYQWRFNGAVIPEATGPTLILSSAQSAHSGTYTVTVSNSAGTASTAGAVLDVYSGETGGTVYFNNHCVACGIDAPVFDADGATKLQGPAYLAQLYAGPSAESLAAVGPAAPFRTGLLAGYVSSGADPTRIVPSVPAGQVAYVEVRAWDCAKGASYEQALAAAGKVGRSQTLALKTGGAGEPPEFPAELTGLQSFAIAPEAIPPVVAITAPAAGVTHDERALLSGTVSDNAGVAAVVWERDGQAVGSLALENGQFRVPDLRLHRGENRFRVVATDVAGNQGAAEVAVTWAPSRVLSVGNAAELQEGQPLAMPLELASEGDVAGLSFLLHYNPEHLAEPGLAWSALVSSALSQVNCDTPGEIRATLSLPAAAIPAGSQVLGQVSFRARSVPSPSETQVAPEALDVADTLGNKITFGTDTAAGAARILPRRLIGDNNANDRLDVGDATLIQRLIARVDVPRTWDVAANDLNQSLDLDSGDVIRVLRVVVGLDPQPEVPAGAGQHGVTAGGRARVALHTSLNQAGSEGAAESTALVTDQLRASPGEFVTVRVWLKNLGTSISAASFTLDYPADALRLLDQQAHRLSPAAAADSVLWNVAPSYGAQTGRVSMAAISARPWTLASGVLAELTFQVQGGVAGLGRWPLQLSAVEVAGKNGYDLRSLPPAVLSLNPPPPRLPGKLQLSGDTRRLFIEGEIGFAYIVEASSDLLEWKPLKTLVNAAGVLEYADPEAAAANARFYRVKEAP